MYNYQGIILLYFNTRKDKWEVTKIINFSIKFNNKDLLLNQNKAINKIKIHKNYFIYNKIEKYKDKKEFIKILKRYDIKDIEIRSLIHEIDFEFKTYKYNNYL